MSAPDIIHSESELTAEIEDLSAYLRGLQPDLRGAAAFRPYELRLQHLREALLAMRLRQAFVRYEPALALSGGSVPATEELFPVAEGISAIGKGQVVLQEKLRALAAQIATLRTETAPQATATDAGHRLLNLNEKLDALNADLLMLPLLERVGEAAQHRLLDDADFRGLFASDKPIAAYVLAIDIRSSTDLMLNARSPRLYAEFTLSLAQALKTVIVENYGIVDKFTGDGLLAFFPEFFAGNDAGYFTLRAAQQAHDLFGSLYAAHRSSFVVVSQGIGLGIGIDYGVVQIVQLAMDVSVVGTPVVYARRMAGAATGVTLLNQPAFEKLSVMHADALEFKPTQVETRQKDLFLAYAARLRDTAEEPVDPEWVGSNAPTVV